MYIINPWQLILVERNIPGASQVFRLRRQREARGLRCTLGDGNTTWVGSRRWPSGAMAGWIPDPKGSMLMAEIRQGFQPPVWMYETPVWINGMILYISICETHMNNGILYISTGDFWTITSIWAMVMKGQKSLKTIWSLEDHIIEFQWLISMVSFRCLRIGLWNKSPFHMFYMQLLFDWYRILVEDTTWASRCFFHVLLSWCNHTFVWYPHSLEKETLNTQRNDTNCTHQGNQKTKSSHVHLDSLEHMFFLKRLTGLNIPSLKVTVCPWKWMVGRLLSFWYGLFSGAFWIGLGISIFLLILEKNASRMPCFLPLKTFCTPRRHRSCSNRFDRIGRLQYLLVQPKRWCLRKDVKSGNRPPKTKTTITIGFRLNALRFLMRINFTICGTMLTNENNMCIQFQWCTSWWFQSIYKELYSQIGSFPQIGIYIKKYLKPPPSVSLHQNQLGYIDFIFYISLASRNNSLSLSLRPFQPSWSLHSDPNPDPNRQSWSVTHWP